MSNLKAQLTAALAGTTSQTPISTETLAQGHALRSVKAELMGMLAERKVACCKITRDGDTHVVWWATGVMQQTPARLLNSAVRKKRVAVEVEI